MRSFVRCCELARGVANTPACVAEYDSRLERPPKALKSLDFVLYEAVRATRRRLQKFSRVAVRTRRPPLSLSTETCLNNACHAVAHDDNNDGRRRTDGEQRRRNAIAGVPIIVAVVNRTPATRLRTALNGAARRPRAADVRWKYSRGPSVLIRDAARREKRKSSPSGQTNGSAAAADCVVRLHARRLR